MRKIITLIAILLLGLTQALAQGYKVRGVIEDETGPVIGATVMETGTSNGVPTGLDGEFELIVSGADASVEVSCIGYASQTFKASAFPSRLILSEDQNFLSEVVVIGYGTVKKSDMTGSVVAIKADEMHRGAVTSPDQMLLGKVSGVRIVPATGTPGESGQIRIRGAASLRANNDPLIVIDGVPITSDGGAGMGNPLSSVNPDDIESYSVLKDASATAIYGSRASNGVIMITTKKGSSGKMEVSYNSSYSVKQNTRTIDMMSGSELRDFINENYSSNAAKIALLGTDDTDWQKQIYRLALQTDQNVSVKGGGKVLPFRVSLGYNLDQATVRTGDSQRGNLDISLTPTFFANHLSVNANAKFVYNKTNWANAGAVGTAIRFDPTKPLRNSTGDYWNWFLDDEMTMPNTQTSANPLSMLYDYVNWNKGLRTISNIQLDYKLHGFEDLRFNLNLGIDKAETNGQKYNKIGSVLAAREGHDLAYIYQNRNTNSILEFYTAYNHDFGKHHVDAMAGYSWQHNYVCYNESRYENVEPRWQEADLFYTQPQNAQEYYLVSFFGRVNYGYDSRYLLTATLRDDASSRFSPKTRWGLFPSVALAWNAKNEEFLRDVDFLSQMKVRLGWGQTGQQDIGGEYYPYLARYLQSSATELMYNMGSGNYQTLSPLAYNPKIKWETTTTWNLGVDYGFFGEKLTGSAEVYYRETTDLLNQVDVPLGSNFSNRVVSNIGAMENKGVELNINYIPVETKDWHWSIGGNITFQDTRITKLTAVKSDDFIGVPTGADLSGTDGYSSLFVEGYAPYTYYLYEQLYLFDKPVLNGLIDRNTSGAITEDDRYNTGKSNTPKAFYGINTNLSYKNWDLSVNAHGQWGNYLINGTWIGFATAYSDDYGKGFLNNISKQYAVDGWTAPLSTEAHYSDMFIENAAFFKVDDINLGYTFRDLRWAKQIRLAASVQNVLTLTKYTGIDPEISNADGVDGAILPRPRLYTLRVNINF